VEHGKLPADRESGRCSGRRPQRNSPLLAAVAEITEPVANRTCREAVMHCRRGDALAGTRRDLDDDAGLARYQLAETRDDLSDCTEFDGIWLEKTLLC